MPLLYECTQCGRENTRERVRPCPNCPTECCVYCSEYHRATTHSQPAIVQTHHIRCNQCAAEGFRSDMVECTRDQHMLCNETCFNLHLETIHLMKGAIVAPGTFRAGGRIDVQKNRALPSMPRARTEAIRPTTSIIEPVTCYEDECMNEGRTRCTECTEYFCNSHWAGEDDYCRARMCQLCYEDHSCPNRVSCEDCSEQVHIEDAHNCAVCEVYRCNACDDDHECPNRKTCFDCEEHMHRENARSCENCTALFCSTGCRRTHSTDSCSVVHAPTEPVRCALSQCPGMIVDGRGYRCNDLTHGLFCCTSHLRLHNSTILHREERMTGETPAQSNTRPLTNAEEGILRGVARNSPSTTPAELTATGLNRGYNTILGSSTREQTIRIDPTRGIAPALCDLPTCGQILPMNRHYVCGSHGRYCSGEHHELHIATHPDHIRVSQMPTEVDPHNLP